MPISQVKPRFSQIISLSRKTAWLGQMALLGLSAFVCQALAGPPIHAEVNASCAPLARTAKGNVCVKTSDVAYNFYGKNAGLVFVFTNTANNQQVTFPGQANLQRPCFHLPAGNYKLEVKTAPVGNTQQSSSRAYAVMVEACGRQDGPYKDKPLTMQK